MGGKQLVLIWALILHGCASSSNLVSHDIFDAPASYVDNRVRLCGFLAFRFENNNIYPSRSAIEDDVSGLGVSTDSIEHDNLKELDNRFVCLSGIMYYRGCSKERICTSSSFLYAINVESANLPDQ